MPHRQKRLTRFGVTGIKGAINPDKAREILDKKKTKREKLIIVYKKLDERELQMVRDRIYLNEVAHELPRIEYLSYEHKQEIANILHSKIKDRRKAERIRQLF